MPGGLQPGGDDLAVAVDELDEGGVRLDGQQATDPRVAGRGGGDKGGYVVALGTPAEVAANPKSVTGEFLKPYLKAHNKVA